MKSSDDKTNVMRLLDKAKISYIPHAFAVRKQANRERGVDDEIARIEAMSPRARSKWHRDRLAKLKEWKADQDPANNPALAEAAALEQKRERLLEEQNAKLDKIAGLLQEAVSL